jgi:hypothetical protein
MACCSSRAPRFSRGCRRRTCRAHVEWALRQPGTRGRPISLGLAAEALNERNIPSPKGGRWGGEQVKRLGNRLGLRRPPAGKPKTLPAHRSSTTSEDVVVGFETEARTRGVIRAASPLDTPMDRGREAPSADSAQRFDGIEDAAVGPRTECTNSGRDLTQHLAYLPNPGAQRRTRIDRELAGRADTASRCGRRSR